MMRTDAPIILRRDCAAVMVPSGEKATLPAGSSVWITRAHGGSCTVMTERGYMARIDGGDADALGMAEFPQVKDESPGAAVNAEEVEKSVWNQLRTCFDPEIPVNVVDLGLIYRCSVEAIGDGAYRAAVRFTLTAQGCGMGEFFKQDIRKKISAVPGICETEVELVWDPPWNQSMISETAKQRLGME